MTISLDLTGRVALVTGGAAASGRGIAERLVAAGAAVTSCGRNEPADELAARGRRLRRRRRPRRRRGRADRRHRDRATRPARRRREQRRRRAEQPTPPPRRPASASAFIALNLIAAAPGRAGGQRA